MMKQVTSSFTDQLDGRASPAFQERVLNASIIRADIGTSFEEYLEIFDRLL